MALRNKNEYQESSWGVKGDRRVRLTNLPPSVSRLSRENVGASTSHNPMGLHGLLHGIAFTLIYAYVSKVTPAKRSEKKYAFSTSPLCITYHSILIHLNLNVQIIYGENHQL
jgi:hypothetical protein